MASLARDVWWDGLDDARYYWCHDSITELAEDIERVQQGARVLVTFGHVLLQTRADTEAINDFVSIVKVASSQSELCDVVAIDAHRNWDTRSQFRHACHDFRCALEDAGLTVSHWDVPDIGSALLGQVRA